MPVPKNAIFPPEFPGPAAPQTASVAPVPIVYESAWPEEMTLRVYAAIHLRVPDSGIEWLDKMIERSRKLDKQAG